MNIILTNDDGYGAPGIEALAEAARGLGDPIIVAPQHEFSGCGHQVTTHAPLGVNHRGDHRYAIGGTPADCTRLALRELFPAADLVLAGINAGGNLGVDTYISGTVAGAREAVILGVPGIAVSQYRKKNIPIDWKRATRWAHEVIGDLLEANKLRSAAGEPNLWNINFPSLPEDAPDPPVVFCDLDVSSLNVQFRDHDVGGGGAPMSHESEYMYAGAYDQRPRISGGDVDTCFGGSIAVTRLRL